MSQKLEKKLHEVMIGQHLGSYKHIVMAAHRTGSVSVADYDFGVLNMCVDLMNANVLKFNKREMIKGKEYVVYKLTENGSSLALEIEAEKA